MKRLTTKTHWDGTYDARKSQPSLQLTGIRNHCNRLILQKILETGIEGKRILEVGAGDSIWLPYLAKVFPSSGCVGVDYSERGCALLLERSRTEDANVEVVHEDIFVDNSPLHGTFDVVMSFGVVEHFSDLSHALSVQKRYLRSGGIMFTLIPNMAGMVGLLARIWNRKVYEQHNPHDWSSLVRGHHHAGLEVISGGYLGSSNFGVLSACFSEPRGVSLYMYKALVAVSLGLWSVEGLTGNFPATKVFSPYIYAVSRLA